MTDTVHPLILEKQRREARLAAGLPLHETAEELASEERRILDSERGKREKAIETECDRRMRSLGWFVVRFSQPRATKQSSGIPDRRYQHEHRRAAFWFEAKAPGGVQSEPQKDFMRRERAAGCDYVLGGVGDLERYLLTQGYAMVDVAGQWVNP